jgi:hypothetical protein
LGWISDSLRLVACFDSISAVLSTAACIAALTEFA